MLTAFKNLIVVLEQIESRNLKSIEKVLILPILKPVMFNYQIVSMVMGNIGKTCHPELFFRTNLQYLTLSNRHKNFHQGISIPQNRRFCQILVIDIPKYI